MTSAAKTLDDLGFGSARDAGCAISRMPRKVRDAVSRALVDGADWKAVRDICNAAGYPGVRPQNVTNYRKGAHRDYLAREERIESIRRDSEATAAVVSHYVEHGGSPAEAGLLAASEIMSKALVGMGPEMLQELMATDPKSLFGITRELARVAEMLGRKAAISNLKSEISNGGEAALSEEEQNARVVAAVDAALGLTPKKGK